VSRAVLVGREELVVDLVEVRRVGDIGELALDYRDDLDGQGRARGLDDVAELDDSLVDLGVGAVERDGGVEALQRKQILLCKEKETNVSKKTK